MARKRIKGITIELDGETKGLDKALQDINKRSRDLQSELREVDRALKFNPDNVELLAQKQQLLTDQIDNTTEKLNKLRSVQDQVEKQFKSGEIGADQYRAFRREIVKTESQLDGFKRELAKIDDTKAIDNLKKDFQGVQRETEEATRDVKEFGNELSNVAAGLAAGAGIGEIIEKSLDTSSLNTKIEISMDVPEESIKSVKEAINTVTAYGVDAESALEGVRRQWALNANASDESNKRIIQGAGAIAAAYSGIDFTELIQEINEISGELEITDKEALGLVNSLLKVGFPPEQLDIIAEYGQQLRRAGYEAEDIQAIMAAGVRTDTWNIDNLLDGLKEGRIRLAEFGEEIPKAMGELLDKAGISVEKFQAWGQAVAEGGEEGHTAMQQVVQAIANVEDQTVKNALGTQIWGTMWEDQGQNIIDTLMGIDENLKTTEENQELLNQSLEKLDADPAVQMNQALTELKMALEPLLIEVANFVTKIAQWAQENPKLAATLTTVITVLGILAGVFLGLIPIFTGLGAAATALNIGLLPLTGIILAIIAVIGLLVAAGIAIYKNWDTIKAKAAEVWEAIKTWVIDAWEKIKSATLAVWNAIKSFILGYWRWLGTTALNVFNGIKSVITNAFNIVKNTVFTVWNAIKSFFTNTWNGIKNTATSVFLAIKNAIINAFQGVKNKISGIWSSIWGTIKGFINRIIDGINSMIGGLNKLKFSAPSWVPVIGGKTFGVKIPKIPRLARGGVVSEPTLAMVGDAGLGNPEIVAPEKMLRNIIRETLSELLSNLPQPNNESSRPIILQVDDRIFGQIVGDYMDQEGAKRVRKIERGLA